MPLYDDVAARPSTAPALQTLSKLRLTRRLPNPLHPTSTLPTTTANQLPSTQKLKKVQGTHEYLAVNVDPIMSKLITYLLTSHPTDILGSLHTYFSALDRDEEAPVPVSHLNPQTTKDYIKVSGRDRIYTSRRMAPVITLLINRFIAGRPVDKAVIGFGLKVIEECQSDPSLLEVKVDEPASVVVSTPVPASKLDMNLLPKTLTILVLGPSTSGKSSLLQSITGSLAPKTQPTMGFAPLTLPLPVGGNKKISFYDLGGSEKIYGIWQNYYHDCHCYFYVFDLNVIDDEQVKMFWRVRNEGYMKGKDCVVWGNKSDLNKGITLDGLKDKLFAGLSKEEVDKESGVIDFRICCSDARLRGFGNETEVDPSIDLGLETLLLKITANFPSIKERVDADCVSETIKIHVEKQEKDKRVFIKSICKGFGLRGETVTDKFTSPDGYEFLSQEMGLMTADECPVEGREIAELVGYQKLALMMVGGMKAPISSKKKVWSWEEIKGFVLECREEIGEGLEAGAVVAAVVAEVVAA